MIVARSGKGITRTDDGMVHMTAEFAASQAVLIARTMIAQAILNGIDFDATLIGAGLCPEGTKSSISYIADYLSAQDKSPGPPTLRVVE